MEEKSRRTWSVSRCICKVSRENCCWVWTNLCTDSASDSSERDSDPISSVVACCSCRLSEALWDKRSRRLRGSTEAGWGGIRAGAERDDEAATEGAINVAVLAAEGPLNVL